MNQVVDRAFNAVKNAKNVFTENEYNRLSAFIGQVNNGCVSLGFFNDAKRIVERHKNDFTGGGYDIAMRIFTERPENLGYGKVNGFHQLENLAWGLESLKKSK